MYPPNSYLCYQCSFVIEGNRVDLGHAKSRALLEGGAEPGMVLRIMNYEPNRKPIYLDMLEQSIGWP